MAIVLGAGDVEVDLPRLAVELREALRAGVDGAGQAGAGQAAAGLAGAGQAGGGLAGGGLAGAGQAGAGQAGAGLAGAWQDGAGQVDAGVGPAGVGRAGVGPAGTGQAGASQAEPAQAGAGQAGVSPAGVGQAGADQAGAGQAVAGQRIRAQVTPDITAMVLMPGVAPGIPAYTVKVHAKNPNRSPAITGVICLHDLETGDLLALIDSAGLTALRTGLGGALGAHLLARPDARHVTVIGAGAQGRAQLQALAALRPIESVRVRDIDPAAERRFAAWAEGLGIRVVETGRAAGLDAADEPRRAAGRDRTDEPHEAAGRDAATGLDQAPELDAADGLGEGEIVLMATWSREPVLHRVPPGTHITSLGADEPGKVELAPELLAEALVVVDDPRLAHVGADATIGQVLRGEHPGRTSADQVTVYSPAGLPMQDLVIAWHVFRNACRKSPVVFDVGASQR